MNRAPKVAEPERAQYLLFDVAGQRYGVLAARVTEILALSELTRVPRLAEWIRGLMNLRGTILPVVDLSIKFGFGPTPVTRLTTVVVAEVDHDGVRTLLGFTTNLVHDVVDLDLESIQPPPPFGTTVDVSYLQGMVKIDETFILLLDMNRLLSLEELFGLRAHLDTREDEVVAERRDS